MRKPHRNRVGRRPQKSSGDVNGERLEQIARELLRSKDREEALRRRNQELERERERFLSLFQAMPIGYAILNGHGLIVEHNEELDRILQVEPGTRLKVPLFNYVSKDQLSLLLNHFRIARVSSTPVAMHLHLLRGDRTPVPVEVVSLRWIQPKSDKIFFRTVVIDTSKRSEAEQSLMHTRKNLQTVLHALEGVVWEADAARLDVTFVSAYAEKLLGYPTAHWFQPHFWEDHILSGDRDRVMTAFHKALREKTNLSVEYRVVTADRRVLWLCDRIRINYDGARPRLLGIAVDVTHQKETEHELEEARGQLEARVAERTSELERVVGDLEAFSYSLSHDLRAPLRAIQSYSELLQNRLQNKLHPTELDFITRMQASTIRMDALIQDVLQYSRVLRAPVDLHPVDLEKIVNGVIQDYPALQPPNADIELKKPLLPVVGHEAFLTQCVSNLLGNAVKFVVPGQKPRVRVETRAINSDVEIWFEDNGIGIEPEDQKRVFGIFQRGARTGQTEGTGIGLAIVKKAVERMRGTVGVASAPGKGTRFWLRLPAAPNGSE